uniref:Uncharacterized protein n=1 Tax=Pyxicephalus adspersus TaxID=30357 RepID=A0AAV2ZX31_PYXAD|nr:TPA: hypothetical protein GDO54_014090 [Pyxicephalus adspersus]
MAWGLLICIKVRHTHSMQSMHLSIHVADIVAHYINKHEGVNSGKVIKNTISAYLNLCSKLKTYMLTKIIPHLMWIKIGCQLIKKKKSTPPFIMLLTAKNYSALL